MITFSTSFNSSNLTPRLVEEFGIVVVFIEAILSIVTSVDLGFWIRWPYERSRRAPLLVS